MNELTKRTAGPNELSNKIIQSNEMDDNSDDDDDDDENKTNDKQGVFEKILERFKNTLNRVIFID